MLERISGSLLDPDALYASNIELFHSPELRGLNLVMGFTGFADAGHVVKQINAELLDSLDAQPVAVFDAEIGRASCRERVLVSVRSRWSPYHSSRRRHTRFTIGHLVTGVQTCALPICIICGQL